MTSGNNHSAPQPVLIERPSLGTILLGLIPCLAMCLSVPLWDRIHPMILGIPFNLFWLISWILLTPLCMWVAYKLHLRHASHRSPGPEGASR